MQDWLVRTCEIVDKYQPSIVYFDWWIQQYAWKPYLRKFAAYYYNRSAQWGKETAIDAKFDAYVYGSAVNDLERGQLDHITPDLWQNDTSVAKNSWGYTVGNDYKKPSDVVLDLDRCSQQKRRASSEHRTETGWNHSGRRCTYPERDGKMAESKW